MIEIISFLIFTEPEDADRKKKSSKTKSKGSTAKPVSDAKPNISYPTNFEHTVHVGFDAVTGEFTVNRELLYGYYRFSEFKNDFEFPICGLLFCFWRARLLMHLL